MALRICANLHIRSWVQRLDIQKFNPNSTTTRYVSKPCFPHLYMKIIHLRVALRIHIRKAASSDLSLLGAAMIMNISID